MTLLRHRKRAFDDRVICDENQLKIMSGSRKAIKRKESLEEGKDLDANEEEDPTNVGPGITESYEDV